mgnify:CR=1 FL=1
MGFYMAPKITLVVITTFFPITVGLLDGYKSVDKDSIDLMRAMGATKIQIFFPCEVSGCIAAVLFWVKRFLLLTQL